VLCVLFTYIMETYDIVNKVLHEVSLQKVSRLSTVIALNFCSKDIERQKYEISLKSESSALKQRCICWGILNKSTKGLGSIKKIMSCWLPICQDTFNTSEIVDLQRLLKWTLCLNALTLKRQARWSWEATNSQQNASKEALLYIFFQATYLFWVPFLNIYS